MKKIFFLSISLLLNLSFAGAQVPDDSFLSANAHHLMLEMDAEGFFYDAEYGMPLAKGYTVTGFRLSPSLVYGINEKAQLRVGFNAMLFAGLDSLYMLRPTMTLLYKPASWLTVLAGTLLDDNHHNLPAPVIDPSRHIFNYQEDGIQILTNTKIWKSDTWLDWTHYLTPWTPDQELFTLGSKHEFVLMHIAKGNLLNNLKDSLFTTSGFSRHFIVSFPAHFMASHRGGEVKTIDTNTVTTFNENVGLRFEYSFRNNDKSINVLGLDLPVYFYHLEDTELDNGGKAFYPTFSYCWLRSLVNSKLSILNSFGFWHGNHYFSAFGSPLFWSANAYSRQHFPALFLNPNASIGYDIKDTRNILTYQLSVEHSFKEVALGVKVDALHDVDLGYNDFIFSFFIRYNGLTKIGH